MCPLWRCALFYPTNLDEKTTLLLETEVSGAFVKSDLEIRPDPETALKNAVVAARTFAEHVATEMRSSLELHKMGMEVRFGVRCDGNGTVMIGQNLGNSQLVFKIDLVP